MKGIKPAQLVLIAIAVIVAYIAIIYFIVPRWWRGPLGMIPITVPALIFVPYTFRKAWKNLGLIRQVVLILVTLYIPFFNGYYIVWTVMNAGDDAIRLWRSSTGPSFGILFAVCIIAIGLLLPKVSKDSHSEGQPC